MNNPLTSLSWDAVCARRLARHGLAEPIRAEHLAEQVGVMCGAHAQVMTAAEVSIGLRVSGSTRTTTQDALWKEHSLIKTFGPRGTVHLLRSQDLAMWMGALSAIPLTRNMQAKMKLLTPEKTEAIIEAIGAALADAELTVDELTEAIAAIAGSWAVDPVMDAFQGKWPLWRMVTDTAANRGALCFGPNRGRKITYTSPRRWLPEFRPEDGKTAVPAIVKHFLFAYGPATPGQFAKWLNAPPGWATTLFDSLADELEQVEMDGSRAWLAVGDTMMPHEPPSGVRLLPYFDAYVVGSHPREKVYPGRAGERALAGGQAGNFPTLLIDGVVAGVWHQRRSGQKIHITVEPLEKLTDTQRRALDKQVERIGQIQEGKPTLTIGQVTVGAHA